MLELACTRIPQDGVARAIARLHFHRLVLAPTFPLSRPH